MYGRDWKNEDDYSDIAAYSPAKQAWEFLRRKTTYRIDCHIAYKVHSWIHSLPFQKMVTVQQDVQNNKITGADILKLLPEDSIHSGIRGEVFDGISRLTPIELSIIFANCGEWLFPRHNLRKKHRKLPPMPDENEPKRLIEIFNPLSEGGSIICSPGLSPRVNAPEGYAVVLIDLRNPIGPQIDGLSNKLKELQKGLEGDGPYKKLIAPYEGRVLKSNQAMKELSTYLRILDAKYNNPDMNHMELYEILHPEGYNKGGNNVYARANDYIGKRLKLGIKFRDHDYNHIANKEARSLIKFHV